VTAVLRSNTSEYRALIDTGTNASGETVPPPVDGFYCVPGSQPPHYIFVEHTTIARSRLAQKWLAAPGRGGEAVDLVKALHEVAGIRAHIPAAQFTIVLSTNQRPSSDVMLHAHQMAHAAGVTLDIWDQSRLAHALVMRQTAIGSANITWALTQRCSPSPYWRIRL
jgi:hypothetical protein